MIRYITFSKSFSRHFYQPSQSLTFGIIIPTLFFFKTYLGGASFKNLHRSGKNWHRVFKKYVIIGAVIINEKSVLRSSGGNESRKEMMQVKTRELETKSFSRSELLLFAV